MNLYHHHHHHHHKIIIIIVIKIIYNDITIDITQINESMSDHEIIIDSDDDIHQNSNSSTAITMSDQDETTAITMLDALLMPTSIQYTD